jgi:hypothetical protein
MAEEFHLYLESDAAAAEVERQLGAMRVGDRPALVVRRDGTGLFCGCKIHAAVGKDATVSANGSTEPFLSLFYQVEGVKSGMHHPEGMLWVRGPDRAHAVHEKPLPLAETFPLLLGLLGVRAPETRRSPVPAAATLPEISTGPRADVVAQTV